MIIWCDGEYSSNKSISIEGHGVFTTLRVDDGRPVNLDSHLRRLRNSAESLGIPFRKVPLKKIIMTLSAVNALKQAACRVTLEAASPRITVRLRPLTIRKSAYSLWPVADIRDDPELYRHKVIIRDAYKTMRAEGEKNGADDALIINNGFVLESTVANIFFMRSDSIFTPSLELPILPGIMRDILIQKAGVTECSIREDETGEFSSAFITNSLKGIAPVSSIGDITYDTGPVLSLKEKLGL